MWAREILKAIIIAFLTLDSISVGLRVYVRAWLSKSFGYDDWALILAYGGFVALCITTSISLRAGYGSQDLNSDLEVTAVKFFIISTLEYVLIVFVAKISVALVLFRLARHNNTAIRLIIQISMFCMTLWTIATSIIVGLQCQPLRYAWGEGTGICLSPKLLANTGFAVSAMDIFSSFLYASLPIFLLRGIQLSLQAKISVVVLLGMGIVSSVATIMRLKYLVDVANLQSSVGHEAMEAYLTTFVYSIAELGLTILTASLTALRPLLKKISWGRTIHPISRHISGIFSRKLDLRRILDPSIKLEDSTHDTSTSVSRECVVPRPGGVYKKTEYAVTFTNA
ncbi:unnamed protein product [Periconia digitata]|uniref:Rhodopsin domain-containing protein n=1 Tax=Periconia digitata TaxID=1303443 RepID=A0A9W4UFT1_9PLEO|nr:unnamed protein product [Periconia digitata]